MGMVTAALLLLIRAMGLPDAELTTDELLTEMYPSDACFEVSLSLSDENNGSGHRSLAVIAQIKLTVI